MGAATAGSTERRGVITMPKGGLFVVMSSDVHPIAMRRRRAGAAGSERAAPSRGGPLSPEEFKQHRLLAERRSVPLRAVLEAVAARRARP